jgi:hypothetical protein
MLFFQAVLLLTGTLGLVLGVVAELKIPPQILKIKKKKKLKIVQRHLL